MSLMFFSLDFAHSFPMSPIAFCQCSVKMEFYENLMVFYENLIDFFRFQAISKVLWFKGRLFRGKLGNTLQGPSDLEAWGGVTNPLLTLHISQDLRLRYSLGFQDLGLVTMGLGPSVINAQCGWFHQSAIKKSHCLYSKCLMFQETPSKTLLLVNINS